LDLASAGHRALSSDRASFFARATIRSQPRYHLAAIHAAWSVNMGTSVLISILITFLVIVLILWLVQRLPVEARMRQIIQIVVIIIGIISLLKYLAVF
jgi:hypothetical protein